MNMELPVGLERQWVVMWTEGQEVRGGLGKETLQALEMMTEERITSIT